MTETDISTSKACGKCGSVQDLTAFNKNKNRPDGLAWDCKACNRLRSKRHFDANPAKYNAAGRADYAANKSEYKTRASTWAAGNKEKRQAISKAYVANNPDKRKATQRENRVNNPGLYAAHYKARQQRKRKAMPSWANEGSIKAIYRQCAWVTKVTGIKHHVDHFYPLKNPLVCGLHNEYNLRIIPAVDNLSKGNRIPD